VGLTRSSRRRRIVLSEEYYVPPRASPVVETGLEVVLISPHESDGSSLRRILNDCQSIVRWFPTCESALAFLQEHLVSVVIADLELPDGCWKYLLDDLSRFAPPPSLIVSSRLADERLWAEVLNLGGYDVLLTPFQPDEVLRVSTSAWLAWKHTFMDNSQPRKPAKSKFDLSDSASAIEGALAARSGG
jgi:DNA-binding NtrC family response regulator